MKKILLIVLTLVAYNAYSARFDADAYEFESSDKNTSAVECPMSPYKDQSMVFFRNDTAYMFHPDANMELGDLTVCKELMGLGIEGTFAYDESGKKLYFSKKGKRGNELHEATYKGGKWTDVRKLEITGVKTTTKKSVEKGSSLPIARWVYRESITTGFYNPTLSKNGERVYFSGTFKTGKGDRDLWYIDKEKSNVWSYPQSPGDEINTEYADDYAFLVGDTALFFASSRPGGKGGLDLYVSYLDGDTWGPAQNLESMNSSSDDYNLVFEQLMPYFISERSEGKGGADIYRPVPGAPDKEPELVSDITLAEPKGFHWVLFYFDFDISILKREDATQLDELAAAMKEYPSAKFEVNGHTDIRGSDSYNMALSQRRADHVKRMLTERGIPSEKMVTVPHGKRELAIPNAKNEAEHEQNRRVEVKIINQ